MLLSLEISLSTLLKFCLVLLLLLGKGCVLIACPSLHLDGLPSEDADPLLVSCCLHRHLLFCFFSCIWCPESLSFWGWGFLAECLPSATCHEKTFLSTALIELELFISSLSHISTLSLPFTLLISMIYFTWHLSLSDGISLVISAEEVPCCGRPGQHELIIGGCSL